MIALYSELGRFQLYIERYLRIIKYSVNIWTVKQDNCLISTVLRDQIQIIEANNTSQNWASKVKDILQTTGFYDVWLFPASVNSSSFIPILRNRLRDLYINNWRNGMEQCSSLDVYKEIKITFEQSPYINILENTKHRNILAKLQLSSGPPWPSG